MPPLDGRLIFHRQSTDIPPTIDTPRIGRVLTGILAMYWSVYRVTCDKNSGNLFYNYIFLESPHK